MFWFNFRRRARDAQLADYSFLILSNCSPLPVSVAAYFVYHPVLSQGRGPFTSAGLGYSSWASDSSRSKGYTPADVQLVACNSARSSSLAVVRLTHEPLLARLALSLSREHCS